MTRLTSAPLAPPMARTASADRSRQGQAMPARPGRPRGRRGCRRDSFGDLREVQVHGLGVAGRQDQGRALALVWADRTEDVGGSGALIAGSARAGAALRPSAGDLVLLTDASLVGEFYRVAVERLFACDRLQTRGEAFLKSSIAPAA